MELLQYMAQHTKEDWKCGYCVFKAFVEVAEWSCPCGPRLVRPRTRLGAADE